jgi:anti-anti-sigma regulatory factor
MIRIELDASAKTMTMRIQGSFIGKCAEDAKGLVAHCKRLPKLIVDLSEASVIDSTGEAVLAWLGQLGGEFVAKNSPSQLACERLHLPMVSGVSPASPTLAGCGRSRSNPVQHNK